MRLSFPFSLVLVASSLSATAAWIPQRPSFLAAKNVATTTRTIVSRHAEKNEQGLDAELIPDGSDDATGQQFSKFMDQSAPGDIIKEEEVSVSAPTGKSDSESQPFSKALQETQLSEAEKERGLPEPVPVPEADIPSETRSSLPAPLTEEEKAAALPEPMRVEKIDVSTASTGEDVPISPDIQANQLTEEEKATALPAPTQVVVDPAIANAKVEDEFEPVSPELQATLISEEEKASALPEPISTVVDEEIARQPVKNDGVNDPFSKALLDTKLTPEILQEAQIPSSAELQAIPLTEEDKAAALPEPAAIVVDPAIANAKVEDEFEPVSPELQAAHISEEEKASALPEPITTVVDEEIAGQPFDNHGVNDPFSKDLLDTKLSPEILQEAEAEAGASNPEPNQEVSEVGGNMPPSGPF